MLRWEQDEMACAIEFNSVFRIAMGAVIRQRDLVSNQVVSPRDPFYTAALLVDFLP